MNEITIWHNPSCSKSREAMSILEENNCEAEVVRYLDSTPDETQIRAVIDMLGITPRELMRTKEDKYQELKLQNEFRDSVLILAMAENPKIIERPVIIKGNRAIIGRPTGKIAEFLNS